jgi:hypothetical protein
VSPKDYKAAGVKRSKKIKEEIEKLMKNNDINPGYDSNLDMIKGLQSRRQGGGLGDSGLVDR